MACRKKYARATSEASAGAELVVASSVTRLLFGADSSTRADDLLQNNLQEFEWVVRNKIYPNFFGRYLTGENSLTPEEIIFLHRKGCKIAVIYADINEKQTEQQGVVLAKDVATRAHELGIPEGIAIFLEIREDEPTHPNFLRGFAHALISEGYTPGFKANTDANFSFDRVFSTGMQADKDLVKKCLIWAVAPTLSEYDGMTTSHLIHPDNWTPYAPSAISRKEIAIWQYGKNCHPIENDAGMITTFNLNLVRNEDVIIKKMF